MSYLEQLKGNRIPPSGGVKDGPGKGKRLVQDVLPPVSRRQPDETPRLKQRITPAATATKVSAAEDGSSPAEAPRRSLEAKERQLPSSELPVATSPPPPVEVKSQPPPELIVERELPVRTWEPESIRRSRLKRKIITWLAAGGIAASLLLPTFAFPKFSIVIVPKARTAAVGQMEFTADTALAAPDAASRRVPAMALGLDRTLSQEYQSSGRKFVEEKARGQVVIFNAYSSSPQTLAPNTRFQDPNGKIYRLREGLVVPGAKIVEGKIVPTSITATLYADAAGEEYNIGPAELRIAGFRGTPKYEGFYAKAENGFSGGFKGESAVVLAEDLEQTSQDITRKIFSELQSELDKKIPSGEDFVVPKGGREISVTKLTLPSAGELTQRFSARAEARGRLIALRRSHINEVILAIIPPSQELAIKFPNHQPKIELSGAQFRNNSSQMTFTASGDFTYWLEESLEKLTSLLQNSTPEKAKVYLRSREEIEALEVKKFPRWLWFIPKRAGGFELYIRPPV